MESAAGGKSESRKSKIEMNPAVGSVLWTLLHTYAHGYPDAPSARDVNAALAFLDTFNQLVRTHGTGCRCSQHWQAILAKHPPALESRAAFYWWTARVHDEVNERLGKARAFPGM